jgi:tetratricopeptide (TPR) repeat protein
VPATQLTRPGPRPIELVIVLVALAAWFVSQYAGSFATPFINDDYIFLDKIRDATVATIWAPRDLLFHYYRPWSRELHFAVLQGLFGARELPFHVASAALWLAVMASWFVLARRIAGTRAAAIATAGVAALAAWAVPAYWASGAQDLWMLLFALLAIHAVAGGRMARATVWTAMALISKESAVVIPAIALAWLWTAGFVPALRRSLPLWALAALWAVFHPLALGRLWWSSVQREAIADPATPGAMVLQTLGALLNLAPWPDPERGWGVALAGAAGPGALALVALVAWATFARRPDLRDRDTAPRAGTIAWFGVAWAILGWLPIAQAPTWRAHYTLFGAMGAWLAIAVILARRPAAAMALVAVLALLRPAVGDTPSTDWSSEWYRRRAAEFMRVLRADLMRRHPAPPPHTRMFFVRAPSHVGFLAGDGPALRVWYRDSTLRGYYYGQFEPRPAGAPAGPDLFFRFDSTAGWVEVIAGPEDPERARRANPRWEADHVTLAATLARGGDWPAAAAEYAKLAAANPRRMDHAFNAGVALEALGDSVAAARWYANAAARPGADDEARAAAARFARHLKRAAASR